MKLFQVHEDGRYFVEISNSLRFWLAVDHVSAGLSFSQVSKVIQHTKNRTKIQKLTGLNDHMVGQYIRVLVGVSLNVIADLISDTNSWAFSLAADASTHQGTSLLDQRIHY
jgi:hypothetical protein